MGNRALDVNSKTVDGYFADNAMTVRGSNWLWAVTALFGFVTLVFVAHSFTKPRRDRMFHYLVALITFVAAISYFTMASNLGWASIDVQFRRNNSKVGGATRQIFYVRYIDWFVTTPLLLMCVFLTAAMPWPTILMVLLLDEIMVICGLVGALVESSYKWGYFVFGLAATVGVAYHLLFVGRKHSVPLGKDVSRAYTFGAVWLVFLWLLYPICWGLAEGGNVISVDSEHIFYGILDILAKAVFGAVHIFNHRRISPAHLGLHIRDYDVLPNTHEKHGAGGLTGSHNGVHDGVTGTSTHQPVTTTAV